MQYLNLKDCLGLDRIDRRCFVTAGEINPKTGKAYAINPASGNWDDNYFAQTYGNNAANNYGNPGSVMTPEQYAQQTIKAAQAVRDFNIQSNQPAIASYEASKVPLNQRYQNLLNTIKGNQTVAENRQTVTTGNELAKRGLSNDSGVYQQEMTNAVNPVTQGFTNQYEGALANQNVDLSAIENAIASLKTGNPESSVSAALNIGSQEQQAQQFAQNLAQQKAIADAQMAFQREQSDQSQKQRYLSVGAGGLYDTQTGKVIQGIDALKAQVGGSGW